MNRFLNKPIQHLDVSEVTDVRTLTSALSGVSFQARNLARCVDVCREMLAHDRTVIFLGVAGALVPGGMRKIIADLVAHRLVDVVVSTGANLYHDFFEALGYHHYLGDARADDARLREAKVDRIYDTFASDVEFERAEERILRIAAGVEQRVYSSRELLELLADQIDDEGSILCAARREGVPVFCPALADSAIGMALTRHYAQSRGRPRLMIDPIRDNYEIVQIKRDAPATGAIYLGGGVPKNYIQQLTPMLLTMGFKSEGHTYFVQLTTDDPKHGGLSGCTPSEAESWGKVEGDGSAAMAYVDVTIGLPLLAGALLADRHAVDKRKRPRFTWKGDQLEALDFG
jgi:deoxyhypusine synthase